MSVRKRTEKNCDVYLYRYSIIYAHIFRWNSKQHNVNVYDETRCGRRVVRIAWIWVKRRRTSNGIECRKRKHYAAEIEKWQRKWTMWCWNADSWNNWREESAPNKLCTLLETPLAMFWLLYAVCVCVCIYTRIMCLNVLYVLAMTFKRLCAFKHTKSLSSQ